MNFFIDQLKTFSLAYPNRRSFRSTQGYSQFPECISTIRLTGGTKRKSRHTLDHFILSANLNGPYAPFGFESMKKQLWRNKQNDRPISDSEIKAVLSQLFKTDQWLPPAGHVSEDVTSHA
ncbi:hypothetical protein AVEN_229384-1 [Araneus ventricosus]|uniref:Uncharacterized protein n=1 Tax=Araneus ventricosus TaxID=182803 RepID=A0A4Y2VLU5_ARAVE|nr:hypothetical protein AVEN_67978-1 [Araneus ventricosus]GBO25582.1 hypothetical protein AVEN_22356-1 [Araneus ventricosus]GBO36177.1 hypothetical protein AVEN_229384-1 [Araneus ventricosus]